MRKFFPLLITLLFCAFNINAQNISAADENRAISLVSASKAALGLSSEDLSNVKVAGTYYDAGSGVTRVYLNQTYKAVPVLNQILVLAYKGDKLVSQAGSFNHSLEKLVNVKSIIPSVTAASAVQSALSDRGLHASQMAVVLNTKDNGQKVEFSNMGISHENITAQLMWSAVENSNAVHLTWQVYIIPKTTSDYWMVRVDAMNNSILSIDNLTDYDNWGTPDFNSNIKYPEFAFGGNKQEDNGPFNFKTTEDPSVITTASYRVVPFPAEAPSFPLGAHALKTDPWLAAPGNATSLKWNTGAGGTDYNYTRGNNVWAYQDRANTNTGSIATSASSSTPVPSLTFDFTPNYTVDPTQTTPVPNQQFNTTNLFYWNNIIHDVMYVYGFTEAAYNFQDDNQGRGGAGNDHVNAEAQDGSGSNNANFSTPPDGSSGRMQMYLWTGGTPNRDGDVDNGVVVHEFGHGISNRLTGGGTGSCLGNAEQMGEGWSDYYSLMFTQDWATATLNTGFNSPRGIGTYALFQPTTGLGIRSQKYCTDFAINNKVYLANLPTTPHNRGEIWCATLWDMTWNIINQNGVINPNLYNVAGGGGNTIALKLVTEGLKLQQCSPGFISGRNAILQADQNLYGGAYNCVIWEAFRKRGMGAFASEGSTNSVTDQIPDFTPPVTLGATVSATTIPESSNLNYVNSITTCSALSGYTLRDTLPTNVTYVSGGTYNAATRVVSFTVNQAAGTTNYPFTVNVNAGSYFPPVTLLNETVAGATIPATWTTTAPSGTVWSVVNTQSHSAPNAFFVTNLSAVGDQRLETTTAIALPINSYPKLSFWGAYNTEDGWDGGVVEISTDGGTNWIDLGPYMTLGGYNGGLGASPTNPLNGRAAFTGTSTGFVNTVINLSSFTGQSVKIRFRFGSDDNTAGPTNPTGWWIDDINLTALAAVPMRSSLFNAANTRVFFKDMITEITQNVACNPTITQQPVDAASCAGSSATFTCVGTATGGVTYQWQLSTTGIAGAYTNLANGAPYSNVTTSTLTINPTVIGMDGYYYRCVVTGTCAPTATSNPAKLSVAAGSTAGTVSPANSQVCGTTNSGTLTLTGNVGAVIRWESATNIAGPWTAIANTTNTYTFTNITQTMYYRAVVQFGGCAASNSNIATVTFAASSPMSIIADPGTTICAGDPTLLTAVEPGGPVVNNTLTTTFANNNAFALVTSNFKNNNAGSVTITSIESIAGVAGASTANLYYKVTPVAGAPGAISAANGWILAGTGTYTAITNTTTTTPQVMLTGLSLVIPGGATYGLAFESQLTGGAGNLRYSTVAAGTYTSSAAGCDLISGTNVSYAGGLAPLAPTFTPRAFIGKVNFSAVSVVPITTGTFTWSPAAGLSSTTTNPVAASPMNTTTYTVSHNNGAGCIRQANITITVNQRPVVSTQPVNTVNCAGSTATFTVGGTGAGLTYQWQENTAGCTGGTWVNLVNGGAYAGTNTATLTINPVTGLMTGYGYRCVLGGTCSAVGTANISNCATLTVNPLPVVTITPAGPVCGGVAGIYGTQLSTASSAPPVPGSVSLNSGTINLAVPDNTANGVSNVIAMTGVPANATITNVSVTLNMSHTYPGDMIFNLQAPNGQILNLYKYGTGLFTGAASGVSTWGWYGATVSQTGSTAWSTVAVAPFIYNNSTPWKADAINTPVAGTTIQNPTGFVSNATSFANLYTTPASTTGNWTLAMADGGSGDNGTLASWALKIDYTTPGTGGSPLTYTWSPAAGLYTNATATTPYVAGTQTPVVYAAPTVATLYTATGTNGTTGCVGSSSVLVNYTPAAPVVTPNPVVMCSTDVPVKLKAVSTGTPAIWTPAAGLFSNAAGTTAYIAGTAVDSVWTKPTPAGVYTYQVTARNSLNVLANPATPALGGNGQALVTFNIKNNNLVPVTFNSISSNSLNTGAMTATIWYRTTPVAGPPGAITAANNWIQFGTGTSTSTAGAVTQYLSGLTLVIPAGATYGIALQGLTATNTANISYTNGTGTLTSYSSGGVDIITDGNAAYAGAAAPAAPTFNPRNFNGTVSLSANGVGTCVSPARTVTVTISDPVVLNATLPANQTICTDKVATFTVATTTGTGPFTYQWQVSVANGPFTNITNGGVYSGATTATLTVTAPPVSFSGNRYQVIVNGFGSCPSQVSRIATLTVNPLPIITITPTYSSLLPGLTTVLTATVTPNPGSNFTWIRDGVVLTGASAGVISGIGTNALKVDVDGQGIYSLRVTDVNGCTNTSTATALVKDSVSAKCFIYPNPTSGSFEVRYYSVATNNNLPRTLTVYDAKGDRVYTKLYNIGRPYDRMPVDMRAYGKGLYWVEIGDSNGNRLTICRLVIQ